mgnify:CR=1 FL=1
MQTTRTCSECHGTGKIIKEPCTTCRGKGTVRKQAKVTINIPAGIDDNQTLILKKEGEPGERGGENGDIYVTIHLKRHSIFTRKDNNVLCDIPITITQATLGAELEIPMVNGEKVKYKIPKQSVVYTGTHDNETLLSWLENITPAERRQVRKYLNNFKDSGKELCDDLICLVMQSVANLCIVPMQDYLGLDNSARMNQPSTLGKNWKWRLKEGQFTAELQKEMLELATRYGRR